jgi:hypothetical protein
MIAEVLLLFAQIFFASDAQNVEMQRNGGEIHVNVDGVEYRTIQPVIGEAAVYTNASPER